jgi:AcrR family transcriptional regulator
VNHSTKAGRFPRSAEMRARIVAAARSQFAAHGYHGTAIRTVATEADIHPSMVMRSFERKDGLLAAAAEFDLRLPDAGRAFMLPRWRSRGLGGLLSDLQPS